MPSEPGSAKDSRKTCALVNGSRHGFSLPALILSKVLAFCKEIPTVKRLQIVGTRLGTMFP
jgi:hypothetical protein